MTTPFLLISVHPEYITKILSGEKRFEFRKTCPTAEVSHLVIYATAPVQRWIAVAEVESVLTGSPYSLWERTKRAAGISREVFRRYYAGRSQGVAFKLGRVFSLSAEDSLKIKISGPQSYSFFPRNNFLRLKPCLGEAVIKPTTVFIAGVHGVGKSTFSQRYLLPHGLYCTSASSIIRQNDGDVTKDKKTNHIADNQTKLLRGLNAIRKNYCDIALDGHFTLINGEHKIDPIPTQTFQDIKPDGIIVLRCPAAIIAERLRQRDATSWSVSFIDRFQKKETSTALSFARDNNIPFLIVDSDECANNIVKKLKDFFILLHQQDGIETMNIGKKIL